ncbi:phosphatidylinositol-specific phospholipase C1-like protein [Streptomyces sp. CWNU-52B]|uniref:phosphatidylinositol-specific phospholipase C1-like protein n=1 Tax=unclassified Streptomyces TaxID=2593676 RepID=UPI0039C000B7
MHRYFSGERPAGFRGWFAAATVIVAVAALSSAAQAQPDHDQARGPDRGLRINEVQAIATHNSYHREVSFVEQKFMEEKFPDFRDLLYSHASLRQQFDRQRARGIELDVYPDPQGGLYADPLIRRAAQLPAPADAELEKPGFKVLHVADFDYRSSCVTLRSCLTQVKEWSERRPGHVTVPILLELKQTDPVLEELGGVKSPPWDTAQLDALDAEIRTVFPDEATVTADDIRDEGRTLEQSVLEHGWPRVSQSRGKVMFLMENDDRRIQDAYRAGGRESLQGRVLFTSSEAGRPDAAFMNVDDPTGAERAVVQDLVRRGYFVRTNADGALKEAATGDTRMLTDALASGAQMVSTDFPAPGLAARYGSDYVAELPGTTGPVRCNPVNVRKWQCPRSPLEP